MPVTGPQVSSLQRLAGQGAAVLPQVSSSWEGPGGDLSSVPSPQALRFEVATALGKDLLGRVPSPS